MTRHFDLRGRTLACMTLAMSAAACDSPLLHRFPAAKDPAQLGSCDTSGLTTPTSLAVTRVAAGEIVLAWVSSGTVDGFELERREAGGAWQLLITLTDPSVTSYTDRAGIVANSSYEYRVAATLQSCTSSPSDVTTAYTTPPSITVGGTGWYAEATAVTVACAAGSPVPLDSCRYEWDVDEGCVGGAPAGAPAAIPADGAAHVLYVCAKDQLDLGARATVTLGVDVTAPSLATDKAGWYTAATQVTVTTVAGGSGVAWVRYTWDVNDACASGAAYSAPLAVPAAGGTLHTLYLCAQSGAGVRSTTSATMAMDTTAPSLSVNRSGWYTTATDVTLTTGDAESGVVFTRYLWDVDDACASGTSYTAPFPVATGAGGLHTLYVCAENGAGAHSTLAETMAVDTVAPTVGASVSGWQVPGTTVAIASADPESGVAWTRYAWDTDTACLGAPYTAALTVPTGTTLHTLYMCTQNGAGATTTANATMAVTATPPTVTADRAGWYTSASTVTLTATDGESGIAWTRYEWDVNDACTTGTPYTTALAVPAGNHGLRTLYVCAQNNAGAQISTSFKMGVDTTPPTVTTNTNGWYAGSVTIAVTYADPESGAAVRRYKWDDPTGVCTNGIDYTGPIAFSTPGTPQHTLYLCAQSGASASLETNTSVGIGIDLAPVPTAFAASVRHVNESVSTPVTWTWNLNNAHPDPTCSIDLGVPAKVSGDTTSVTQTAAAAYTLTCGNSAGSNTAKYTIGIIKPFTSGQTAPAILATDGTTVYWVSGTTIRKPSGALGGGVTDLVTSVAVGRLAVDASSIYWTDTTANEVWKASKFNGAGPTKLATATQIGGLSVDATNVCWTDSSAGTVLCQPVAGGTTATVATGQLVPLELASEAGGNVYWVERAASPQGIRGGLVGSTCAGTHCVWLSDVALATPRGGNSALVQDAAHLYLVSQDLSAVDHVLQFPKTGGGSQDLYGLGSMNPVITAVVSDGATVYFTSEDGAGSSYYIQSIDLMSGTTLIEGSPTGSTARSLSVVGDSLYWAAPDAGSIMLMTPR